VVCKQGKEQLVKRDQRVSQLLFALALVLTACTAGVAQTLPQGPALDSFIQATMKEWKVPGAAVAIVHDQSVVYIHAFGVRDIRTGQPVTPATLFDIGSCTKAFTAAAIAMLVDEGKMGWDAKVSEYIPFFHLRDPLADESVTIRDLLTHRTGLPATDDIWYGSPFIREEILRRMVYAKPNAGFRARFQYQNVMYLAAGYAAGRAAGMSWDDFVRQRIFAPLGMADSDTSAAAAQQAADFAAPHSEKRDGSVAAIHWRNIDNIGPAGAINSSVRDMTKWIALQLNNGEYRGQRLISEKNVREMHTPQMIVPLDAGITRIFFPDSMQISYGLGWFIQDYRGHQLILHPGDIDGFSALVALVPELDTGYVVLINMGGGYARQVIGYHIADSLLNLSETDWTAHFRKLTADLAAQRKRAIESWQSKQIPGTHPSHDLAAYAGTYESKLYGEARISLENGRLVLHFHSFDSALDHFQYDTFVVSIPDLARVTFVTGADGSVAKFMFGGITFRRAGAGRSAN
jgi:CubicO group peptidase (beta-lactamase class C family)